MIMILSSFFELMVGLGKSGNLIWYAWSIISTFPLPGLPNFPRSMAIRVRALKRKLSILEDLDLNLKEQTYL